MKKFFSCLLVICLVITLAAGCGKKPAEEPKKEDKNAFKVGLLLPGSIDDGGWNTTAYNGLKAIEQTLGAEISYVEKVPQSDMEEVFRNFASTGYNLIIGHGFEFGDAATKVAKEFPEVTFIITSTDISQAPNLGSLLTNNYEQGFLQGATAAILSESGVIGGVGGMEIPPITADLAGYEAGAKYVNPNIKVVNVMTGSFDDAAKAKEQAAAMIDQGADVVMHDADAAGLGVIEACDDSGVYSIGSIGKQFDLGKNVIACGTTDMPFAFAKVAEKVKDGSFKPQNYNMGVADGVVDLVLNSNIKIDEEKLAKINDIVEKVKKGEIKVMDLINK